MYGDADTPIDSRSWQLLVPRGILRHSLAKQGTKESLWWPPRWPQLPRAPPEGLKTAPRTRLTTNPGLTQPRWTPPGLGRRLTEEISAGNRARAPRCFLMRRSGPKATPSTPCHDDSSLESVRSTLWSCKRVYTFFHTRKTSIGLSNRLLDVRKRFS